MTHEFPGPWEIINESSSEPIEGHCTWVPNQFEHCDKSDGAPGIWWISIPVISWKHFFFTISSNGYLDVSGACDIMYYITVIILNHKNHNFYTWNRVKTDSCRIHSGGRHTWTCLWLASWALSVCYSKDQTGIVIYKVSSTIHSWSLLMLSNLAPYWVAICVWFVRFCESLSDPLSFNKIFIGRLRRPHQAPKSSRRMEPQQIHQRVAR